MDAWNECLIAAAILHFISSEVVLHISQQEALLPRGAQHVRLKTCAAECKVKANMQRGPNFMDHGVQVNVSKCLCRVDVLISLVIMFVGRVLGFWCQLAAIAFCRIFFECIVECNCIVGYCAFLVAGSHLWNSLTAGRHLSFNADFFGTASKLVFSHSFPLNGIYPWSPPY